MGGEIELMDRHEAAALLEWWREAGVDMAVSEEPHNWLAAAPPKETVAEAPPAPTAEMPDNLEAFRDWLMTSSDLPHAEKARRRIAPTGKEESDIMVLAGIPASADGDQPIGGDAWALAQNMIAAIGLDAGDAYITNILPFALLGTKLDSTAASRCADIARHHVALAKPKRLLLFGDGPAKLLLDGAVAKVRNKVHGVEGVRTVATFAPKFLLNQPSYKARAWRDLLLLMGDDG